MNERPNWTDYFLTIASMVSTRSNCSRRKIGAVLVKSKNIISSGYNGTPTGMKNCSDGGCPRCASATGTMSNYDLCTCVHAEVNAIVLAARHGNATDGCILYCTCRPCLNCLLFCIQAGITAIIYNQEHKYPDEAVEATFISIVKESGIKMHRVWESYGPDEPLQTNTKVIGED